MPHTHMWVMPQKARTLTTSSAGGCRAGHARPTKAASCKGRGMLPSTAGFQLVENTRNDFNQSPLLMHNHVLPHTNGAAINQQRFGGNSHLLSAIFYGCQGLGCLNQPHPAKSRQAPKPHKRVSFKRTSPLTNVFVKPNEQCRTCSSIVMARKRTYRGTRKERFH